MTDPRYTPPTIPTWTFVQNSEATTAAEAAEEYRAAVEDFRALRGLPALVQQVRVVPFAPDADTHYAVYVRPTRGS